MGAQAVWPTVTEPEAPEAGVKSMRSMVRVMLPSPGSVWMLKTAFASTVPSVFVSGLV